MKSMYVSSLEQAEKMKEMGIRQDVLYSWFGDKSHIPEEYNPEKKPWVWIGYTVPENSTEEEHRGLINSENPIAATFTVNELIQMLPANVLCAKTENGEFEATITQKDYPEFDCQGGVSFFVKSDYSMAEALAGLLIYAASRSIPRFTVKEINSRINADQVSV